MQMRVLSVIQSTPCLRGTCQVPQRLPDALEILCSPCTSRRATRRLGHVRLCFRAFTPPWLCLLRLSTPTLLSGGPTPGLVHDSPVWRRYACTSTAPGRAARYTPAKLNLKGRASRPRGCRCKRTRRASAPRAVQSSFVPRRSFPRGLEPVGPGWGVCVSALRAFPGLS